MRRTSPTSGPIVTLVLLLLGSGCALFGLGGGASEIPEGRQSSATMGSAVAGAHAGNDHVRDGERRSYGQVQSPELDRAEKDLHKALELALGRQPAVAGGPTPYAASKCVTELRQAKIALRLEPVVDAAGKPVASNLLQLKDSYTDRVQILSRKMAEQKATKREMKEMQDGAKHMVKLGDLRGQITAATMPAMSSGWLVTSSSLNTMLAVSQMVRARRTYGMQWTTQDYELVATILGRQKRAEAIGAVAIAMLAAYQAVLEKGADPKTLDVVAEQTLAVFPLKATVSVDEARSYVEQLDENIAATKARYEAQMRSTFGDAQYEKSYRASIDAMFAQAEQSTSAQPVQGIAGGGRAPAGHAAAPVPSSAAASGGRAVAAVGSAKAGDVAGTALNAAQMVPGGSAAGSVGAALGGVSALTQRDPKGAIDAAIQLAPVSGPIKAALQTSSALIDVAVKTGRRGRG